MDGEVISAVIVMIAAAIVVAGCRPVTDRVLTRWSIRFNVLVEGDLRWFVRRRLRRARSVRSAAIAGGVLIAELPILMNVIDPDRAASFSNPAVQSAPIAAGAFGALLAEVAVAQRPVRRGAATLSARRVDHYIDTVSSRIVAGASVIAAGAAIMAVGRGDGQLRWATVGIACCAAAVLALAVGFRSIVTRPRLAHEGNLRSIDDAFRADGAHHLAGAAVALAVYGAGMVLTATLPWVGLVTPFPIAGALGWWWTLARNARWNVDQRRTTSV